MIKLAVSDVFSVLQEIVAVVWTVFGDCAKTIMDNPLLFVPVLIAIGGTLIMFGIGVFKRLGVKGVSSSGRRRRRR